MNNLMIIDNVDFDNSYQNVLNFMTKQQQENYFNNKIVMTFENTTYTRTNRGVKINANYNGLLNYNYIQFDNEIGGVLKRFYAFIVDIIYISPSVTELIFEIDVMQTYMFDYEIKESFVEREHQNRWKIKSDSVLEPVFSLTDENLDYGNSYMLKDNKVLEEYETRFGDIVSRQNNTTPLIWYYILSTEKIGDFGEETIINGISTGLYIYLLPNRFVKNTSVFGEIKMSRVGLDDITYTYDALNINKLTNNSSILSISATRYSPYPYTINNNILSLPDDAQFRLSVVNDGIKDCYIYQLWFHTEQNEISVLLDGLNIEQPINRMNVHNLASQDLETKLLTNPFNFYKVRMNDEELIFNIENFTEHKDEQKLNVFKSFSMKNSSLIWLDKYLSDNKNLSVAKATANENEITLRRESWEQYERNNKATLKSGLISGVAQTGLGLGLGLATGGVGLAVAGASAINTGFGIYNELQRRKDIKQQSDSVVNAIGDIALNITKNELFFGLEHYEIEPSFKEKIFKYLLHFGYKANEFKKPKLTSRYYYNYIKTIGVNIVGNINNNVLSIIKNIYDRGVTLWHYRDANIFKGIGNYDYENVETDFLILEE